MYSYVLTLMCWISSSIIAQTFFSSRTVTMWKIYQLTVGLRIFPVCNFDKSVPSTYLLNFGKVK